MMVVGAHTIIHVCYSSKHCPSPPPLHKQMPIKTAAHLSSTTPPPLQPAMSPLRYLLLLLVIAFAVTSSFAQKPDKHSNPTIPVDGNQPGVKIPSLETEQHDSTVEEDLHHYKKKKPYYHGHPRHPPQEGEKEGDNTVAADAHYKKKPKPGHYKKPPLEV